MHWILRKSRNLFWALLFICAMSQSLFAQIPANAIGLNPPSLKWSQINTDRVQVIFPSSLDSAGQRVANLIHYLWENNTASVGEKKQKVTILLQNQTTIANGFVTVGPFRSEFYMTPPQFNYTTDWLDILAIHEYRHVQQFGNSRRGITNLARTLFGSWAWGGFFGLSLPRWYLEGDATGMETALSQSGRGRLPSFDMEYRSLLLNNIDYTYEKAAAGSFKDFVPNWYNLGYYMTTYARKEYGQDVWANVVADATSYKGLIYPFNRGLELRTGLKVKDLYHNTMDDLRKIWKEDSNTKALTIGEKRNKQSKKTITHYTHPRYIDDNTVIAVKRGFNQIPIFVQLTEDGIETSIIEPGIVGDPLSSTLSYSNGKICWSEFSFDARWLNQDYSIIRSYTLGDIKVKKKLSSKSKYFAPSISWDGNKIIAVEATPDLKYSLVILNAEDGALIKQIPNQRNTFYSFPSWMEDNEHIIVVAQQGELTWLQKINLSNGITEDISPKSNQHLSHPFVKGEWVYFSASYTGINNIFALQIQSKDIYQITSSPFGAFHPSVSPDNNKLVYSDFNPNGYDIQEISLEPNSWKKYRIESPSSLQYYKILEQQEGGSIFNKVGNEQFETKKFNKWNGIINIHSWLPFLEPPVFGAQILSDNKFSTLSMQAGGYYNVNEDEWSFSGGLAYAEFFPVINANYTFSNRSSAFYNFAPANDTTILRNIYVEEWEESRVSGGFTIPLNLTSGNFFNRLTFSANFQNININTDNRFDEPGNLRDTITVNPGSINRLDYLFRTPLENTSFNAMDVRFNFRSFRRMARQHINPRVGLNLDFRLRTTIGTDDYQSDVFIGRADLFLPGLSKNHSFVINTMFQREDVLDNYRFSNFFIFPRGYDTVFGDRVIKTGFNYYWPLFYPDAAFGGLAFLKRVKANIFYDHAWLMADDPFVGPWTQNSTGIELTFDVRFLRILEVDLGFRYSYLLGNSFLPSNGRNQFDFLLFSITQ